MEQNSLHQLVSVALAEERISPTVFDRGAIQTEQNELFYASNADMVDGNINHGETTGLDLNSNLYNIPPGDVYLGLDGMNALTDYEFPVDLWFNDLSPTDVFNLPQTNPLPEKVPEGSAKTSEPFGVNTYANSPLFHLLDKNTAKSLEINLICDFLNDEECWKQVRDVSEKTRKNEMRIQPVIHHQIRDILLAITYFNLSGRPEQVLPRTLSFRFPCLETIQCLFDSCFSKFLRMYPFIHPTSFMQSMQPSRASITYPLFLQTIMIMGALLLPNKEARAFAIELGYITRRAMHDTVVRDELTTDDVWLLSATLVITAFGAWSGNKKHIEIAEGYRGSYTVVRLRYPSNSLVYTKYCQMFHRRGYLRPQRRHHGDEEQEISWKDWIDQERKRR